ncbi:TOBE domain-containing protein [Natronobacterium gregoryi]|uniref:ModE family transcriptional regulator n=2 Tax=Natronobacterium gregoryi TaxID=44930 RepID=L0ALK5_NATGS|nr:TOBE domain-containing protein [Natronobacterium gregoryi]AFZ74334.1 molybdenum-binding protein [Natronobacterium gregoryi SP2]ELY63430.1 ModE family transcriptional regulator [Natronobacterium gregoryi SP2]PLK22156.1 molybdenum-binding protein [Natronobacterium gregoryi SP2]SFI53944.1 molybdate transport system regulatory protein [Natronobacterium gregoryi]
MSIEKGYRTTLSVDGVTIDRRDVEMLEAIDEYGSMHRAAEELGRSYARLQNRVVEIEEAVGSITERQRGGSGGGGTELTETARELRRQFERHDAELGGVAQVIESVFTGTVGERTGELATVDTPAGQIVALVPKNATSVQVSVRSDAVVLTDPGGTPDPDRTSLRNSFTGTVTQTVPGDAIVRVTLALENDGDTDRELQALVTRASANSLKLEPGREVVASFKATAARATRIDDES